MGLPDLLSVYDAFGRVHVFRRSSTLETLAGTSGSVTVGETPVWTTIVCEGDSGWSVPPLTNLPILAVTLRNKYNPRTNPPEAAIPKEVALYLISRRSVS